MFSYLFVFSNLNEKLKISPFNKQQTKKIKVNTISISDKMNSTLSFVV